jgi:uncharacterized protein YecE (DUF72 family)
VEIRAGTSGFSYKGWKGNFYPDKLPAGEMLHYYGRQLPAVEINNTFYRLPKASVLENWAAQVPESFRFSVKASRRITHFKRLEDAGEPTGYFLQAVAALGERLGVVLFQLPPSFRLDLDRLDGFLELIPPGTPAAFEFRHPSWSDREVFQRLERRGLALCHSDTDGAAPTDPVPTASWGYLRLRRSDYSEPDLQAWLARIRRTGWEQAFVFFKHEDEGAGPRMARRFLELAAGERSG